MNIFALTMCVCVCVRMRALRNNFYEGDFIQSQLGILLLNDIQQRDGGGSMERVAV